MTSRRRLPRRPTIWPLVRPWLGLGIFLYEAAQPIFGRPVEPLIVGGAIAMMGLELLRRADSGEHEDLGQ